MKVVLDIETIPAPREEWARLAGRVLHDSGSPAEDLFALADAEAQRKT